MSYRPSASILHGHSAAMIASVVGGIAIFLIGMTLLSDGVKAAAGGTLRRTLTRLTGGAFRAFLSGAAITALVQSSSATTLTTIGFVSAGLLSFTQAIGIVIGANVGTTSTGWLVSLLGLHVSIGAFAVPLMAVGALMRLAGRGRTASVGLAIAGFGLLFFGIGLLQLGMEQLAGSLDLSRHAAGSYAGWVLLFGIGIAMTVVMQSSSAAVAATLTALHAGAIGLPQAALLVVGQNVGTTVTAAIAAIGASTPARRTAVAHILFNVLTAIVALLVLPAVIPLALRIRAADISSAVIIAAFHTCFNLLGAALVLPFAGRFARAVSRLVPARGPQLTSHLDPSVALVTPVAVESARLTGLDIAALLRGVLVDVLRGEKVAHPVAARLDACDQALEETRRFLASVRSPVTSAVEHTRHVAVLHAMDHLERLVGLLRAAFPSRALHCSRTVSGAAELLRTSLREITQLADPATTATAETIARRIAADRRVERPRILERAAAGELSPDAAVECLDALRWVENLAYHWWRTEYHLSATPPATPAAGTAIHADGGQRVA